MIRLIWRFVLPTLLLLLASVGLVAVVFVTNLSSQNRAYLLSVYSADDATIYAPAFDEMKFERVHVGMSGDQLLSLLGPPLWAGIECGDEKKHVPLPLEDLEGLFMSLQCQGNKPSRKVYIYAHQGSPEGNYKVRAVSITDDLVSEIRASYQYD